MLSGDFDHQHQHRNQRPAMMMMADEKQHDTMANPQAQARPNNSNTNANTNVNTNSSERIIEPPEFTRRYRPQKFCSVCGDKAIACNFNAVTCESCKAFFRRNAFKEARLKCLFENRCVIDRVTRRFCSKCRLLKCFQIGMKREWILTDEQKQSKRSKVVQNKQPARQQEPSPSSPASNSLSQSPPSGPTSSQRARLSSYSSTSSPNQHHHKVEMRDASTSCQDDLVSGFCSMAAHCHYCSIRLTSNISKAAGDYQLFAGRQQLSVASSGLDMSFQAAANSANFTTAQYNGYQIAQPYEQQHQQQSVAAAVSPHLHMLTTAPQGAAVVYSEANKTQAPSERPGQEAQTGGNDNSSNPFVLALDARTLDGLGASSQSPALKTPAQKDSAAGSDDADTQQATSPSSPPPQQQQPPQPPVVQSGGELSAYCQISCAHCSLVYQQETDDVDASSRLRAYYMWEGKMYLRPAHTEREARIRADSLEFNANEKQLIDELIEATKCMFSCWRDENTRRSNDTLNNFVQFCDAALRRLIKTVKQVKAFRLLSMDDQIVLLKTACFKILLLRSAYHYQQSLSGWLDLRSGKVLQLDFLKRSKKSSVYDRHNELVTDLPEPLRRDRIILAIMSMALLFDPHIELKHSNSVRLDNLVYLSLLRKYLLNTQPDPLTKYELLVSALQKVNACNEEYNVFFSEDFQPGQITPLLVEIFDISINNSDI